MAANRFLSFPLWVQWTLLTLAGFMIGSIVGVIGGFFGIPLFGFLLGCNLCTSLSDKLL